MTCLLFSSCKIPTVLQLYKHMSGCSSQHAHLLMLASTRSPMLICQHTCAATCSNLHCHIISKLH